MSNELTKRETLLLNRLSLAESNVINAQREFEDAKRAAIEWLKSQPLGRHLVIDHHILNTECRELTDEEYLAMYDRERIRDEQSIGARANHDS
jgi:anion-transporting  ArsA/GET3 family ATPase